MPKRLKTPAFDNSYFQTKYMRNHAKSSQKVKAKHAIVRCEYKKCTRCSSLANFVTSDPDFVVRCSTKLIPESY